MFSDILFADDTMGCSGARKAIQILLHLIETVSAWFGLLLNKDKCEVLRMGTATNNIYFQDGTKVTSVTEAT
eukprot:6333389-Prorocentrum_lima.AAC.1